MEGYIALFIAVVTTLVGAYHFKNCPKEYPLSIYYGISKYNPAGVGLGIIFLAVLFLSLFFLCLNVIFGVVICLLILFVDCVIFIKIRTK